MALPCARPLWRRDHSDDRFDPGVLSTVYPAFRIADPPLYEERGRPLGWLFGAMAGGMAFGSPLGAMVVPFIGWRGLFLTAAAVGGVVLLLILPHRRRIAAAMQPVGGSLGDLLRGYASLLGTVRGRRTYGYVFVNSMFHSGVFIWLGVYLERRYRLDSVGIGLALLGYGVPGSLFGPLIGLAVSTLAVAALLLPFPLFLAPAVALVLSLGYDMTQPLLAGIVTALGGQRPGQAMGLNVFMLFVGFGLGSLAFAARLRSGFGAALGTFAAVELIAMLYSVRAFRAEIPSRALGNAAHPYP